MYRDDNSSGRSLSQFDEEAVEYMYERGFNSGGVENNVNCTDMEGDLQWHYAP